MAENYQKKLDAILAALKKEGKLPRLLLHACCAPCSSYVLEYLTEYFDITVLYYNPNISLQEEYDKRVKELNRLVREMPFSHSVQVVADRYDPREFYEAVPDRAADREKGASCYRCYQLRMRRAAEYASLQGYDYFTTTLSISPMKNAQWLNEIGVELASEYEVPFLYSDFKKRNGYKRSIELSAAYGLYRQDYCGCIFSRKEREAQKNELKSELM